MHNVTNGFVIYFILTKDAKLMEMHILFFSKVIETEFIVTLGVLCFLNILGLIFLIDLIKFHIELQMKGLTTYEFLKLKKRVSKESKIVVKIN